MRLAVPLLLVSCASTPEFRAPHWPAYPATRAAIRCAVEKEHGAAVARDTDEYTVRTTENPPYQEHVQCETCPRPIVIIDWDEREGPAMALLRHVVFAHFVPRRLGFTYNYSHTVEEANAVERRLQETAAGCKESVP